MKDIIIPAGYREQFQAAFRQLQVYLLKNGIDVDLGLLVISNHKDLDDQIDKILKEHNVAPTVYNTNLVYKVQTTYQDMMLQVMVSLANDEEE